MLARTIKNDAKEGFTLNPDDWFQIVPKGDFEHADVGTQVLDSDALKAMTDAFNRDASKRNFPGLRVDYDHFSYDTAQSSRAAGWIRSIENRDDGIYARIHWTPSGKSAVEGGAFRLVSPVFTDLVEVGKNRVRPTRLDSVALTNNPNLKAMAPLSNRSGNPISSAGAGGTTTTMKSIATALGLPEDAAEAVVLGAVTKLTNRATTAETRVTALETQVAQHESEQIERDLEPLKNRMEEPKLAHWRTLLKNDRKNTLPVLQDVIASISKTAAPGKTYNRADTKTPQANKPEESNEDRAAANRILNRAKEISTAQRIPFADAWRMASSEVASK